LSKRMRHDKAALNLLPLRFEPGVVWFQLHGGGGRPLRFEPAVVWFQLHGCGGRPLNLLCFGFSYMVVGVDR
jgi:hypothetical protein